MQLIQELQRRNVFRVAVGYVVSSWLLLQIADLGLDIVGSPDWVLRTIALVLALGFPVVAFFAWAYEVTPEGIKRESEIDRSQSIAQTTGRKLDRAILVVLLLAVAYFAYDKFILDPQRDAALLESVSQAKSNLQPVDEPVTRDEEATQSGPPMVAVLPFVSSSMEGDSDFFATGVHDDLLTQLAQLQSIRVISRTSVLEYRDTTRNIREIGKALGADAIMEGGVQSAGDRIRINAQLIDARTDEHLWAQTFDRELSPANIFEVQTEIARAITSALHATLTTQESAQLAEMPTENMAAYRAYHRAMEIRDATDGFDHLAFRRELEEAVTLDPEFTRAWAELVGIFSLESFGQEVPEALRQAEQALQQIRTVAPESADYLFAQAYYTYYILKDFELAHQQAEAALAMRPSDARIVEAKSWIERRMGDLGARIESVRLAGTLDPRNTKWFRLLIRDLILTHRYDEASSEIAVFQGQDYSASYWQSLLQLRERRDFGRWAETVAAAQKELGNDEDLFTVWETHIANRDFKAAKELTHNMQDSPQIGIRMFASLGDKQRARMITPWFLQDEKQLAELLLDAHAELEEMRELQGDSPSPSLIYDQALVAAIEGNTQEAERMIRLWDRNSDADLAEKFYRRHRMCRVLGIAGATAAAVDCIRKGLVEPSLVMPFMEPYLPYYDSMRDEPEFAALLSELAASG
ncbi:MAG: hypothetical protein OET41_05810 [Xanthomonadales bacterium]|nr:hypothetical protein [Xanthomonadales bacterium]MDH4000326.1 hypothetical protein [Xanthomonadales bacterium]